MSTHSTVRQALKENNIVYTVAYPDRSEKDRYIFRFLRRGNSEIFINMINTKWNEFIDQIETEAFPARYKLPLGDYYLSDIINKLIK